MTHNSFSKKKGPKNPYFYSVFVFRVFGPRCKKGKFWKATPKKEKIWLITEKLFFGSFAVFFLASFFFVFICLFFFCFCVFFFGGFKGEVARRATSLGPKPSFFLFFLFCFFVAFFLGGFKGQGRWPEGPPHLALNPPSFFFLGFFCWFFWFFGSFFNTNKKPCFPP